MYERVFIWIKETEEKIFFERKQIFALIFRSWSKDRINIFQNQMYKSVYNFQLSKQAEH